MAEESVTLKPATQRLPESRRHEGVELGRLIASVAVIIIHVPSFLSKYFDFAVPYFFALSGFFLANKLNPQHVDLSALKSISIRHWRLFIFWALMYSFLPSNWPQLILHGNIASGILETLTNSFDKFVINPVNWLLDGPPGGFHLWYLTNAPLAAAVVFLSLKLKLRWLLLPLAIASLAILLSLTPDQCAGTAQWATRAKLGILVAIPALIAGYEFSLRYKGSGQIFIGSILILLGIGMKILELHLSEEGGISTGSISIGAGLFITLLNFPRLPGGSLWRELGKLTVGVYILHIAVRPIYFSVAPKVQWLPDSLGFVILAALTYCIVWVLTKFRTAKRWLL